MNLKSLWLAAALPLAACASDMTTQTAEGADPEVVELEGTTGTIPVKHAWGVQQEQYRIVDGDIIIRGDIIAGHASELHQRSTVMVGTRWPNAQVRFAFEDDYPADTKQRARDAFAEMEADSPLDFIEIANPCVVNDPDCDTDYVLLRIWDNTWGVSALGYQGGQQRIKSGSGFSKGGFKHEMMHALGIYHEQERNDRDTYVLYRPECVIDEYEGNYSKNADPDVDFGTYDFLSIMHYRSNPVSSTLPEEERLAAPCNGGWPLTRKQGTCPAPFCTDADGNGSREFINGSGSMSATDVDALWGMYAPGLAAHEAGDLFGQALAFGDFDDDGREDLAIGVPYEDTVSNTVSAAGAVMLYKGTEDGFQPWKLITQGSIGALEEANDNLGAALAVGDWNDDGVDDLAIGAPGESVGGNPAGYAGAVYLMKGTTNGLAFWRAVTQADIGAIVEGGDRFGAALVAGNFNGDGVDDLAVGSPGESHGDGISAGHVYVLRGTGSNTALAAWSSVGQNTLATAPNVAPGGILPPPIALGTNQASDGFGQALAAGRIDDDNIDDLVVGAHCDYEVATCAGGAYLFRGAASGMRGWMRVSQSSGDDAFDRFGWTVAVGDVDMDGDDDVLIGAPYDDYSGVADVGRVYVAKPSGHVIASVGVLSQSGTGSDAGTSDHFGSSIAFGNNGAFDTIAIGARNEAWGAGPAAGAVFIFNASDSGNIGFQEILRAAPASDELAEDAFGTTVITYTDGGRDYLIVANPLEDANAGAVQVFEASPTGTNFDQRQLLLQTTKGTRAP